jgi:hypothetical protein
MKRIAIGIENPDGKKPAYFVPGGQPKVSQTESTNGRKRYSKKQKNFLDNDAGRR